MDSAQAFSTMGEGIYEQDRPLRVVVFGSGPFLFPGVKRFMERLVAHPEIDFVGGFFQAGSSSTSAFIRDVWRRRGLITPFILLAHLGNALGRYLANPRYERQLQELVSQVSEQLYFVPNIHSPEVLQRVKTLNPDLGLVYGAPILKPPLFTIPTVGTLGIHHGKLPEYRGKKTTFWAMYNGEEAAWVSIQRINSGLDTGEIIKQGQVPIAGRTYRVVWNELETLGLDLYIEAILETKCGQAISHQQTHKGKLYRDPKVKDLVTFWWRNAKRRLTGGTIQNR